MHGAIHYDDANGDTIGNGADGTAEKPLNNAADVLTRIAATGLRTVNVLFGQLALTAADWSFIHFASRSASAARINPSGASDAGGCTYLGLDIISDIPAQAASGGVVAENGAFFNADFPGGIMRKVSVFGTVTITADTSANSQFIDCVGSEISGTDPTIDLNDLSRTLIVDRYSGKLDLDNVTHADAYVPISLAGGHLTINASCTAGNIIVRGYGKFTNNGTSTVDATGFVDAADLRFLRALKDRYVLDGTAGENVTLDAGGLMTSGRIRLFATSAAAAAATAGAADDADSETNRIDVAANAQAPGLLGNLKLTTT